MHFDLLNLDIQTKAAIIFMLILAFILYIERKKLQMQKIIFPFLYLVMYKTKIGLKAMDRIANKFPKIVKYLGIAGVFVGFIGMGMICYTLIENLIRILIVPSAPNAVALVLPFKVKGTFFVPPLYWILCIFLLALVHEFSHGVVSRRYGFKVKSSGLAFLGIILPIIPAAFVEPDEKQMAKAPRLQQLSVFAAGSFSNILFAFVALALVIFVMNPVVDSMTEYDGVTIAGMINRTNFSSPAEMAGIAPGEIILSVDNNYTMTIKDLSGVLSKKKPGEMIDIKTNKSEYNFQLASNPENSSIAYMGVYLDQHIVTKPSFEKRFGPYADNVIMWISGLVLWLFILNLGIGLFNLVPIPIADGGRMMYVALLHYFDKKKAMIVWKSVSLFFVLLIIINLLIGFMR